jgi:Tfp pilus assembly protein PilV
LIEVMLSLSIMAIIILAATRYFAVTESVKKVNDAVQIVQNIFAAGERWTTTHRSYSNNDGSDMTLQDLIDRGLPERIKYNPWGGEVAVTGSDTNLTIALEDITKGSCLNLANKLRGSSCDQDTLPDTYCGGKKPGAQPDTFTLTFQQHLKCHNPGVKS